MERKRNQSKFDVERLCELSCHIRFAGGFRPQAVIEVNRGQIESEPGAQFGGKQQECGAVSAAGKADEEFAVVKRCEKFRTKFKIHL